jgi:hypothetical protein
MQSSAVSYETQSQPTITEREYRAFQHAYDFFKAELFGNGCVANMEGRYSDREMFWTDIAIYAACVNS